MLIFLRKLGILISLLIRPRFIVCLYSYFNSRQESVCFINTKSFRVRYANRRMQQMLGYSDQEFFAKPFYEFIHPEDRTRAARECERMALGNRSTSNFIIRCLNNDGTYTKLRWEAFTIFGWYIAEADYVSEDD